MEKKYFTMYEFRHTMSLQEYHEGWNEPNLWSETEKGSMHKLFMEYKPGKASLAYCEQVST